MMRSTLSSSRRSAGRRHVFGATWCRDGLLRDPEGGRTRAAGQSSAARRSRGPASRRSGGGERVLVGGGGDRPLGHAEGGRTLLAGGQGRVGLWMGLETHRSARLPLGDGEGGMMHPKVGRGQHAQISLVVGHERGSHCFRIVAWVSRWMDWMALLNLRLMRTRALAWRKLLWSR